MPHGVPEHAPGRVETIAMTDIDRFRRDLADMLLSTAERRRRSIGDRRPSGEDLKVVALLERLAADAPRLDPHVYRTCGSALAEGPLARRFLQRRDGLLAEIGIMVCPPSATALVAWLHGQVSGDELPAAAAQISISVPISTTCEGGTSK